MMRLLKRLFRSKKTHNQRHDYHTLFHRVGRRLGIARAEVRFLRGELEGLYDRIDGQTHRILEYRRENRALRAQLEALTKVDPGEEVTKPGLVAVRENLAQ